MTTLRASERASRRPVAAGASRSYPMRGAAAVAATPQPASTPRPGREARPDHLRVVRPADRVRRRVNPATGVLFTAVVFVLLFAVAMAHTVLVQGQVELDRLDAQLTAEQSRYQALREDVAELDSPERIVAAAHEQGMVIPDDLVYLQPPEPEPFAGAPEDPSAPAADPPAGSGADRAWPAMKPLLEAPTP